MIFGVVLVLTGVVWFFQSIGWVDSTIWNLYFPLVLVVFGLSILFASQEHACLLCKVMDKSEESKVKKSVVMSEPKTVKPESKTVKNVVAKKVATKKMTVTKKRSN